MSRESGARSLESKKSSEQEKVENRLKNTEEKKQAMASISKEVKKELQKQQKLFQQLEEKIARLNEQKRELETALADPLTYSDKNKFLQTESNYKKASDELVSLNSEYEKIFEKIMELEGQ